MLKLILENKLIAIVVHIVLGYLCTISGFPILLGLSIVVLSLITLFSTGNRNEEATMLASYVVGIEVFLRMTRGAISYEMGKYGAMLFLLIGLTQSGLKGKFNIAFVIYLFFMLLGIVFTDVPDGESIRKAISFNISGPITLGICALYFYKRPFTFEQIMDSLFFILLPIFSMISYLYIRTPNLREMVFGTSSNFTTSGEFGPNQVATIIGFGMFVIGVFMFLKVKLTGYIILDAFFFAYFAYRGLITFSRGGMITAVIAFIFFSVFILIYQKGSLMTVLKYIGISLSFVLAIWVFTSDVTGGMLNNRYKGKDRSGKQKELTTGRVDIFTDQISEFREAPFFGLGVGNGKFKREKEGAAVAASHNEISRLIEEHGVLGLISLLILFSSPLFHFMSSNNLQRAFIVSFFLLWFLTVNHSAMRIAFPAYIYGLSLIKLRSDEN